MQIIFSPRSALRYCLFATAIVLGVAFSLPCQSQTSGAELDGHVVDEDSHPVSRVEVVPSDDQPESQPLYTDAAGHFEMKLPGPGQVHLKLSKPGFFRIDDKVVD